MTPPNLAVVEIKAFIPARDFELGAGEISRAVMHRTVEEIWFVVSGRGQMWRRQGQREEAVALESGTCLTIPMGTQFQFRAAPAEPLSVVAVTMPRWPGDDEAVVVSGPWAPSGSRVPGLSDDAAPHAAMSADPIAAVMIHVPDVQAALSWYEQAFPSAERKRVESHDFEYLAIGSVMLELVPADAKVASGAAGSVVYWHVADFDKALEHFERLGAVLYRGPMEIENGRRICQVRDPWGNCIGLRGPEESRLSFG
jgi:mannose-6-phosphate isomerase-like protein (cupin superfamily)/predicted enzyme related to lactoylglutathione lyase